MSQPLSAVSYTRAWHWGIAIASDSTLGGLIPSVDPHARVSANDNGLVVLVRHAQDTDPVGDSAGDAGEWAEATVTVSWWTEEAERPDRPFVAFDGTLSTPSGRLVLGDADLDIAVQCPQPQTRVRVAMADDRTAPSVVWLDLS